MILSKFILTILGATWIAIGNGLWLTAYKDSDRDLGCKTIMAGSAMVMLGMQL